MSFVWVFLVVDWLISWLVCLFVCFASWKIPVNSLSGGVINFLPRGTSSEIPGWFRLPMALLGHLSSFAVSNEDDIKRQNGSVRISIRKDNKKTIHFHPDLYRWLRNTWSTGPVVSKFVAM